MTTADLQSLPRDSGSAAQQKGCQLAALLQNMQLWPALISDPEQQAYFELLGAIAAGVFRL